MTVRSIEQSIMVPLPNGHQLHLRRLTDDPDGPPVLLLHGLLEDGTIFYTQAGRGLAHYLAEQGYDVFIPDLRGKGRSWPPVSGWANYRVGDAVTQDLPALLQSIYSIKGSMPKYWFAHAWGGILASCFLARYQGYRSNINGLIYFGSHRVASKRNLSQLIWLDGLWSWLGKFFSRFKGYIPGRQLRLGAENEFLGIQQDSASWLQGNPWVDSQDQFNYGEALSQGLDYPPALYFAASSDLAYCNAKDVKDFIRELGSHNGRLVVLGQKEGNQHNYSHITMLTHSDAVQDHFPFMLNWMLEMNRLRQEADIGDDYTPHDKTIRNDGK